MVLLQDEIHRGLCDNDRVRSDVENAVAKELGREVKVTFRAAAEPEGGSGADLDRILREAVHIEIEEE